jgi:recombinational DNA repair protein RecR
MLCAEQCGRRVLAGHIFCSLCERNKIAARKALQHSRAEHGLCMDCGDPSEAALCRSCRMGRRQAQLCLTCEQPSGQAYCPRCR